MKIDKTKSLKDAATHNLICEFCGTTDTVTLKNKDMLPENVCKMCQESTFSNAVRMLQKRNRR